MKKGFTLIELLAVIVVLAIIAVIAIPIVGSVIDTGKSGAIENSVEFYIKEMESKYSEWVIEGIPVELTQDKSETGYIKFDVEELNNVLKLQGTKPIDGTVKIDNNYSDDSLYFGYVINAEFIYDDGYVATYIYDITTNKSSISIVES